MIGLLADDGLADPQKIGATGPSYGGGLSMSLGALKDRIIKQSFVAGLYGTGIP